MYSAMSTANMKKATWSDVVLAYARFGLGMGASEELIKQTYRKLSMSRHPDKGGSKEAFQDLTNDFASRKVSLETVQTACAELATQGASNLCRNA